MEEDLDLGSDLDTEQTQDGAGFQGLDVAYSNHPSIQKFGGDINKMAKSYLSLEKVFGQGKVAIPKDENDTVAWEMYDKATGVPNDISEYQYDEQSDLVDSEVFSKLMKDNHISSKTANKLMNAYADSLRQIQQWYQEKEVGDIDEAEGQLRQEWGMKYEQNMQKANNTLSLLTGRDQQLYNHIVNKVGNDPAFIKLFSAIGDKISEGSIGGLQEQSLNYVMTPADAKREFQSIMNNPNDPYFKDVVGHKERVAYVNSLLAMMDGGQ